MKTRNGGGCFSVNGTARIYENDREGLERIKQQPDGNLIYQLNKPQANGQSFRILLTHAPYLRPCRQTHLKLTSLELIDKLAAQVPPPRIHRHRYYGVLAPNSPSRASVSDL